MIRTKNSLINIVNANYVQLATVGTAEYTNYRWSFVMSGGEVYYSDTFMTQAEAKTWLGEQLSKG